jgi:hemoglobin-like flavoprotein
MSGPISTENLAALRALFFERLAENNNELILMFSEVERHIGEREHNTILAILADAENRIQDMRTILIALRECLEG